MASKEERLFIAARNGNMEMVRKAVDEGAGVNTCSDYDESTPLSRAALGKHLKIVEYLLANGASAAGKRTASIDLGDLDAIKERVPEMIGSMLGAVAGKMREDHQVEENAQSVAQKGAVRDLTSFDDPPVGDGEFDGMDDEEDYPDSPMAAAARAGAIDVMELLLAKGASAKGTGNISDLPLSQAAAAGHLDACKWLLAHGAKCKGNLVSTPLNSAAEGGNPDIVSLFLAAGADPNYGEPEDGYTALHEVTTVAAARVLVAAGADVNMRCEGALPVSEAGETGNAELVGYLATHTNDDEAVRYAREALAIRSQAGNQQTSSLVDAACFANVDGFAAKLAEPGVDINGRDQDGERTPLLMAAFHSRPRITHLLLEAGADPNVAALASYGGRTALSEVASQAKPSKLDETLAIASALIAAGADSNARDDSGDTPLHHAIHCPELVQLLLNRGADGTLTDEDGRTPLARLHRNLENSTEDEAEAPLDPEDEAEEPEDDEAEFERPTGLVARIKSFFGKPKPKPKGGDLQGLQDLFAEIQATTSQMQGQQVEQWRKSAKCLEEHEARS